MLPASIFIGIPFFRNITFLKDALNSLLGQSDPFWSAVVFDDSRSPDEAMSAKGLVEGLGDHRIQYRRNQNNIGMVANWNQVLCEGRGFDLVCILHGDDRLRPDYVKKMKLASESYPDATGFFCKTVIIGESGAPKFSFPDFYKNLISPKENIIFLKGAEGLSHLIRGNFVFCPSLCFRTKQIEGQLFKGELKMVPDLEYLSRFLLEGGFWVGLNNGPLFDYRRHSTNTTVELTKDLTRFKEEVLFYRSLGEQLRKSGLEKIAYEADNLRVVKMNLLYHMVSASLSLSFSRLKHYFDFYLDL